MPFSTKAIKYFCSLKTPALRLDGIDLINPYKNNNVKTAVKSFFTKFYDDDKKRLFVLGINPGRFGGGLTGIAFTDPVALREDCGVENCFGERKELSSKFIYTVIDKFGGTDIFFSKIFLTALYPFAIIKDGKNYNYYDEKLLAGLIQAEIINNLKSQLGFGARRDVALLLGKKNAEYFFPINEEHKFFKKLITLEHPRYIMQYKLKQNHRYIKKYLGAFNT